MQVDSLFFYHSFCTGRCIFWLWSPHQRICFQQIRPSFMEHLKATRSRTQNHLWILGCCFFIWLEIWIVFPFLLHFCARQNTALNKPQLKQMSLPKQWQNWLEVPKAAFCTKQHQKSELHTLLAGFTSPSPMGANPPLSPAAGLCAAHSGEGRGVCPAATRRSFHHSKSLLSMYLHIGAPLWSQSLCLFPCRTWRELWVLPKESIPLNTGRCFAGTSWALLL